MKTKPRSQAEIISDMRARGDAAARDRLRAEAIEAMAAGADQVAGEHTDLTDAIAAEREQAAALLGAVVARIRPALPALCSRVECSERTWWPTDTYTDTETGHFGWRGVCLHGADAPVEDHPRANDGRYIGKGLWLAEDATWYLVDYEGSWSRWQGSGSSWVAGAEELGVDDVVKHVGAAGVEKILARLAEAIESHRGSRSKAAAKAEATTERLAALVKLF